MSRLFNGSICIDTLSKALKEQHTAFTKGANDKVYCNITIWENEEPDKFGNTLSLQLNGRKDAKELEGKVYIGNCKPVNVSPKPIDGNDANCLETTLGKFSPPTQSTSPSAPNATNEIVDDLPF